MSSLVEGFPVSHEREIRGGVRTTSSYRRVVRVANMIFTQFGREVKCGGHPIDVQTQRD